MDSRSGILDATGKTLIHHREGSLCGHRWLDAHESVLVHLTGYCSYIPVWLALQIIPVQTAPLMMIPPNNATLAIKSPPCGNIIGQPKNHPPPVTAPVVRLPLLIFVLAEMYFVLLNC